MNNQEAFDKIVAGRRARNYIPSIEIFGPDNQQRCRYRTSDGTNACAAGDLIPDDRYDLKIEGPALYMMLRTYPSFKDLFEGIENIVESLQSGHDSVAGKFAGNKEIDLKAAFETSFKGIAQQYKLVYTPPATTEEGN